MDMAKLDAVQRYEGVRARLRSVMDRMHFNLAMGTER